MMHTEQTSECSQVIRKRREQAEIRKGYARLSGQVLAIAVTGFLLFTQVFLATQASGNDMFPAVKDGDLLIGFRLQKELSKMISLSMRQKGGRESPGSLVKRTM